MVLNRLARRFYLSDKETDKIILEKYYQFLPQLILKYYKVLLPFMLTVFISYCFTDHYLRKIPELTYTRIPAIVMIIFLMVIQYSPLKQKRNLVVTSNNLYVLSMLFMGVGIISITIKHNLINPGITAFIMLNVGSYFFIKGFRSILLVYSIPLAVSILALVYGLPHYKVKHVEFINPLVIYIGVIAVSILSEKARFKEFYYKTKLAEEKNRTDNLYKEVVNQNSELITLNKAKKEALSELTVANTTKDKLFSIIAHDLRQPFSVLIGLSKVLIEDRKFLTEEDLIEFHKQIHLASESTYKLLENLLHWSMTQTNSLVLNPSSYSINALIQEVVSEVFPSSEQKQIEIKIQLKSDELVFVDRDAFMAITRNILSNAIKFSEPKSEIHISTLIKNQKIELSIKDYGSGINKDTLDKISNSIIVESKPGTKNEKGTGLGLALCRDLVYRSKGSILFESEPGQGTTVRLELPVTSYEN
nr:HAMP domain-containing sensor histidine kinase [uncultured Carboxylicivirga sp.]